MRKLPGWAGIAALAIAVAGLYAQHGAPESASHPAPAAEGKEHVSQTHGESGHAGLEIWKWANFALLAGALGYLIKKNAGPYFAARSLQIRQEMMDAEDLRKKADARAADVDRRLANLEAAIGALRTEAAAQSEAESARVARQTAADMAKIQERAGQEISTAGKAARMELKRYSVQLALGLAEQKIRARMSPEAQDALVRGFVQDMADPSGPPPSV